MIREGKEAMKTYTQVELTTFCGEEFDINQ